jgi:hypothetical protein
MEPDQMLNDDDHFGVFDVRSETGLPDQPTHRGSLPVRTRPMAVPIVPSSFGRGR